MRFIIFGFGGHYDHPYCITPFFYCIIQFYYKNGDVCKKLELKRLRFDRDIRVLSLEKIEPKFSEKICLPTKKCRKSLGFQDFVDLFAP